MNVNKYKIVDNVIYTFDKDRQPDPKGVGHYYYTQMLKNKERLAQIDGYTKEEDTYGSLLQRTVRTSLAMLDKGLKPGDFISLCSYNHLNSVIPLLASFFTGTIMSAIDPVMGVQEAVFLLKQTLPKMIFVTPTEVLLVEKVIERLGIKTEIVVFGKTSTHTSFEDFLLPHKAENSFEPTEVESLNKIAFVVFSSGTSGMPKAICHSHFNMMCFSEKDVPEYTNFLCTMSNLYSNVSVAFLNEAISLGFPRIVYPKFCYEEPWIMFYQYVDVAFINTLQALHTIRSKKPEMVDLKNVKELYIGGSPLTRNQIEELCLNLPYTSIIHDYGQSEVLCSIFEQDDYPSELEVVKNNVGSVGTIRSGHFYKIVDLETGKVLGPNQVGELLIKSPGQFIGYLNQDSSECFDLDGWLKTGDLFYYNEDLRFYYVDRIKESFKFQMHHISPVQIENIILGLEPVEAVVVIGIPHETEVNHPIAVVKLKPNAKKITAEEIVQHVENSLDDNKRLRGGVKFVDEFPMTSTGKFNRFKVKKMIMNNNI